MKNSLQGVNVVDGGLGLCLNRWWSDLHAVMEEIEVRYNRWEFCGGYIHHNIYVVEYIVRIEM